MYNFFIKTYQNWKFSVGIYSKDRNGKQIYDTQQKRIFSNYSSNKKYNISLIMIDKLNLTKNNKQWYKVFGYPSFYGLQIKAYSTKLPESNVIKYDKKRILEIINSIKDTPNFKTAFTHKSVSLAKTENKSYERFEYLGDSLIDYYTNKFIFISFPDYDEGKLTQLRCSMVGSKNLAKISKEIELDKYLKIGPNVVISTKILDDIYQSFVSALYFEKGEEILHEFLSLTLFNRPETKDLLKNYKLNKHSSNISVPNKSSYREEININKEKISSNSLREIIFKFPKDDVNQNKLLVTSEEQINILKNIYNILDKISKTNSSLFNNMINQVSSLINKSQEILNKFKSYEENQNKIYNSNFDLLNKINQLSSHHEAMGQEILNKLKSYEENQNVRYTQLLTEFIQYKENIYKQFINNNNNIKELINIIKELNNNVKSEIIKLNSRLTVIIFIFAVVFALIISIYLF